MALILIIEDDDQTRRVLKIMLEREGYDVLEADDGLEGIKLFRENAVDLIITDIIMFEKDGVTTIMEVRKDSPNVRIIAISGGARVGPEVYLQLAKRVGADYALTKPIDRKELLNTISELLRPPR
ncbi:MAG TPA: response regulator [Spirochaetes bacterium]|nr:response regulator [Spirochaetota bacterium]